MTVLSRLAIVLVVGAGLANGARAVEFEISELWIQSGDQRHHFVVEIAAAPEQRAQGLMFRREMDPGAGMLFDFGATGHVAMWMKNTFLPLDMLFVTEQGRIHNLAERTTPLSLDAIESGGPVRAVIELNAGTVRRLGIRAGDVVEHPMFEASESP